MSRVERAAPRRAGPRAGARVLAAADGPAREAGVAEGDLVVAVDGAPVSSPEAFTAAVEARPAGTLTLTLESAGTRRDVQVKVPRKAPGR